MALAQSTPVIIMDEPTSYLDIGQQIKFSQMVKDLAQCGKTVILVLHDLLTALKISDQICVMENGNILLQDTPQAIQNSSFIKSLFGVTIKTVPTPEGNQYYYQMES